MQGTQPSVTETVPVTVTETPGEETAIAGTAETEPVPDTSNGNVPDTQTTGEAVKPGKVRGPMRVWAAALGQWFQVVDIATALRLNSMTARKNLDALVKAGQFRKKNTGGAAFYQFVGDTTPA